MRKLTLSILVLGALFGANAQANNTITFIGEVSDQTCDVTINGNASNPTVLLPTVSTADLASAGATAGETAFTIAVSGCTAAAQALPINTVFVGNSVTGAGNLGNTGTATNVALQLLDGVGGTGINLIGGATVAGLNLDAAATSASYDFAVQYITETGTATSGSVTGSVQYAVSYQ